MNRNFIITAIAFLVILCLCTCKKDEQSKLWISIENLSNIDIDTLKIYSYSGGVNDILKGPIIFRNITSGSITEKKEYFNIETSFIFDAYFQVDSAKGYWNYPSAPIDPSGNVYLPNGDYCFGIIQCDTVEGKLIIGLLSD